MQQDHVESKAEEKSRSGRARAKADPDLTSQARAVLNLQNTAGNRALAGILGAPAKNAPLPGTARRAVSVQRDELTDAIQSEFGAGLVVDYRSLARMLVRNWQATESAPLAEREKTVDAEKAKEDAGGTETTTEKAEKTKKAKKVQETEVPLTPDQLERAIKKKTEEVELSEKKFSEGPSQLDEQMESLTLREQLVKLRLRQKALSAGKSKTQLDLEARDEDLTAREGEQSEADKLRKEEAALKRPQTALGRANAAKKAELDEIKKRRKAEQDEIDKGKKAAQERVDKRKKLEEMKRRLRGDLTPEERADQELDDQLADLKKKQEEDEKMRQFERERKPLNPQGQSLTKVLGGRRF